MMHKNCVEEAVHKTLKTLEEIVDDADNTFCEDELMMVKQCFSILEKSTAVLSKLKD